MRHFQHGQSGVRDGLSWRVRRGNKSSRDDLVLQVRLAQGWVPVPMSWGALFAEFLYENEEYLYPRAAGWEGGLKYLDFIFKSVLDMPSGINNAARRHETELSHARLRKRLERTLFDPGAPT